MGFGGKKMKEIFVCCSRIEREVEREIEIEEKA